MNNNFMMFADGYKLCHHNQYPTGTKSIYSYFESRVGAAFPYTVFYGLQGLLKEHMTGQVIWPTHIHDMKELSTEYFGDNLLFNEDGWKDILNRYEGRLPIEIKAVPEGSVIPTSNVLLTVQNTDPKHAWLTNFVETILTNVWYPSTVATLSRQVKEDLKAWLNMTSDNSNGLPFMLHDFGARGVENVEAAGIGGSAHIVNFLGTDTLAGMQYARNQYKAEVKGLAYSVPATEHSVMTAEGEGGESLVVKRLLDNHPTGILSIVGDSYSIYNFVDNIIASNKEQIQNRKPNSFGVAKVVVRPDSKTPIHPNCGDQVVWILNSLAKTFGTLINSKGYAVLNQCVGVLWGDGIDRQGINDICQKVEEAGFSVESLVFGMGGGLLQKINRDTNRFAFKCSAREDSEGVWHDIYKKPLDESKASKRGKLKLVNTENGYKTVKTGTYCLYPDQLQTVFKNGYMTKEYSFADVRKNSELG